jgi:cyanophycinase-like exopeptidase
MGRSQGPRPVCLLAGGRSSLRRGPDPLIARALSFAGKPSPSVAYVGAPSGDNRAFFVMIGGLLKKAGAGAVTLVRLCGRRPDLGLARDELARADAVFVTGGDVEEGMRVLEATGMTPLLKELHAGGKPFLGVSAGTIMLAHSWIRWKDPDDEASAELFPCLGLAGVFCDTHGEDDGWEELAALIRIAPDGAVGHGIPSNTGLVVHPDGGVEAAGGPVHRFVRRGGSAVRIENLDPPPAAR